MAFRLAGCGDQHGSSRRLPIIRNHRVAPGPLTCTRKKPCHFQSIATPRAVQRLMRRSVLDHWMRSQARSTARQIRNDNALPGKWDVWPLKAAQIHIGLCISNDQSTRVYQYLSAGLITSLSITMRGDITGPDRPTSAWFQSETSPEARSGNSPPFLPNGLEMEFLDLHLPCRSSENPLQ